MYGAGEGLGTRHLYCDHENHTGIETVVGKQGAQIFKRRTQLWEDECMHVTHRVIGRSRDSRNGDTGAWVGTSQCTVCRNLTLAFKV